MKWIGQQIYDQISKFRNTVDFSEDVTFYQPVNNANPTISIGSSNDERLKIFVDYQGTTTQTAQIAAFKTHTESGTAHDGRFHFIVDEANILKIQDGGIDFFAGKGIGINGVDILTDNGSGTATLSNIDALDATTINTIEDGIGGIGNQFTFANDGAETNTSLLSMLSNQDPGDKFTIATTTHGATTLTTIDDDATAAHFEIAADGDITLDSAGQIKLEPVAGNNILLDGTIAVDAGVVTGATSITSTAFVGGLTGQADTVATIAGLAPNTATTQATQGNITTCSSLVSIGTITTGVWNATEIASAKMAAGTASAKGALELATTGEADTGTDTARAVTPAGLKSHVDTYARKCILRHQAFYVNDNPMVQNSLYFGSSLGHQLGNWNDPQAAGGVIGDTASFTINKVDENWGMLLPFDISKVEVQCSLQPQLGTGDDFTIAMYTGIRGDNSAAALTLTLVAHNSISFSSSANRYVQNDVSVTADYAKGTMIYVGVGSEDATDAKNGRGYLTVTVTER